MALERTEKLVSLFLAVFCCGLAAQLASVGMAPAQGLGAAVAVAGSLGLALGVRIWPARARTDARKQGSRLRP